MELPAQLEKLRHKRIWLCFPRIWNEQKHNGLGGWDKPPVSPHTMRNASTTNLSDWGTFEQAHARLHDWCLVRCKGHSEPLKEQVFDVGIVLSASGLCGIDLDNVYDPYKNFLTLEAKSIIADMQSYTELSPSLTGAHILFEGRLPDTIHKIVKPCPDAFGGNKAEYQLFDAGCLTISGDCAMFNYALAERTDVCRLVHQRYFTQMVEPIQSLSSERPQYALTNAAHGATLERWQEELKRLSENEILQAIFRSGSYGARAKRLYEGDMSEADGDWSRADQALCAVLFNFTQDIALTERLFRASALYRVPGIAGKSKCYLERTLRKASQNSRPSIGYIQFTEEERRQYGQQRNKNSGGHHG